jgi:hypothetical protein
MEFFLVLLGVIAIIAFARASNLRKELDAHLQEYRDKVTDLTGEIFRLKQELSQLSKPVTPEKATAKSPEAVQSAAVSTAPVPPRGKTKDGQIFEHQKDEVLVQQPVAASVPPPPATVPLRAAAREAEAPPIPAFHQPQYAPYRPAQSVSTGARTAEDSLRQQNAARAPRFAFAEPKKPRKSIADRLRMTLPLEELLGMNLFAKIGIVMLVLGFAFLGQYAFTAMDPGARVALIYAAGAVMLGAGIRFESKDRYRLVARAGIGGGWAMLFFTTYAMNHVSAMAVLGSDIIDCILMLIVAAGMVAHTLRYRSQVVTGLAFLLAFSTVALSQDSIYALAAGVILAIGIASIALRMGWFELEAFGITASYANHFYWLYKLYPDGFAGRHFPEFWASVMILLCYWAIFRVSYIARKIKSPRDEKISTVSALLNTILLGAVMKFQSTHPEMAFYALLGLGAVEFALGQLPVTRRRRVAFTLLTIIGSILIFAAVPFKFSGNNIALFWMIAAEVLLAAGIVQKEVLFRRIGLLGGVVTGLLVGYEASGIIDLRQHSDAPRIEDGFLLLTCAALFYFNAQFLRRKWKDLFAGFDKFAAILQGYLGCLTAFLGAWAIFTSDWTAIAWAVLMIGTACGVRWLNDRHMLVQSCALAVAATVQGLAVDCHFSIQYPNHIAVRYMALPILAAIFYAVAWLLSGVEDLRTYQRTSALWIGSLFLALLAWLDVAPAWVAPVWMAFAIALNLFARRLRMNALAYQQHVLVVAVTLQLFFENLFASGARDRYLPILSCAAAYYAISRFCTLREAVHRHQMAWAHTWIATALLAALAWHESPQPWLAPIWAVFALTLVLTDRIFTVEELPWQAYLLALLAVIQTVACNLFTDEKWRAIDLRLITVSIVIAVLYAMARWVRLPESVRESELRHIYTWVASSLAAWVLWSELQPISVALGIAVLGLLLFEWGKWRQIRQLRLQGYLAMAAAFGRIFFVNLTAATLPGEWLSPRIYTVAPLALIYFYVWSRLQSKQSKPEIRGWQVRDLIAYFGSASLAALLYYETATEWIVVAWAAMALLLFATAWLLDKDIFLEHAVLLTAGTFGRGLTHNIFGSSYFVSGGWCDRLLVVMIACALLLAALPIAFQLRKRYAERSEISRIGRLLAIHRSEQWLFFAPMLLIAILLAVKMRPGILTLSWGIEGLIAIMLGLVASQRSYRLTGMSLLLLCVAKIIVFDAWQLGQRDRYITFIALGAALTLVSTLYGKYRETIRRLL